MQEWWRAKQNKVIRHHADLQQTTTETALGHGNRPAASLQFAYQAHVSLDDVVLLWTFIEEKAFPNGEFKTET